MIIDKIYGEQHGRSQGWIYRERAVLKRYHGDKIDKLREVRVRVRVGGWGGWMGRVDGVGGWREREGRG